MIYTLPIISALIGWVTNWIAIKMLFHPRKPVNLIVFTIQGIFPKRQKELARKIGDLVANQLFSIDDIKKDFIKEENMQEVFLLIDQRIEVFLKEKLKEAMPMLAMIMNDKLLAKIKNTLMEEFKSVLPDMINKFADKLEENVDIQKTVEDKVAAFSFEQLEGILFAILKKEFKFIELIGAILGFLIGCIQVAMVYYMPK